MDMITPIDTVGIRPGSSERITDETAGWVKRNIVGYNELIGTSKDPHNDRYLQFLQEVNQSNVISMIEDGGLGEEADYFSGVNLDEDFDPEKYRLKPQDFGPVVAWAGRRSCGIIPPVAQMISLYDRGTDAYQVIKNKELGNFVVSKTYSIPKIYRNDFVIVK